MAKHPIAQTSMPRAMPLLVGLTAGLLAALVLAVQLAAKDLSVAAAWHDLTGGGQLRFASASVLWAIAGVSFVVGGAAAMLLVKNPPPWQSLRGLRWVIGTVVLFGLAHVAHGVSAPHGISPGTVVAANILAIAIAAIMALVGAFFARPR